VTFDVEELTQQKASKDETHTHSPHYPILCMYTHCID
jgi:hypothetical protein